MKHFCQQASRLVSDSCERTLSPIERLRLKLHLLMCRLCRRYEREVRFMQELLNRLQQDAPGTDARLSDADRERIRKALQAIAAQETEPPTHGT